MDNSTKAPNKELLIPDCCNLGVVFRVLIFVNVAVFLGLFARYQSWGQLIQEFAETSTLVELICLFSLATLCGFRLMALRQTFPRWAQRLVCAVIPALYCAMFLTYFEQLEWFRFSFPRLQSEAAIVLSFLLGAMVQHYFELRARAFSPALGEAKLQALQARIRPHFLFNSLNAVLSLIRSEPRRAETALEDLADLFRVLMRDTRDMTTLAEEIRFCQQYLAIEKLRLGERLQIEWQLDTLTSSELNEGRIASLLLQPLLENAVHYGIEPANSEGKIKIEIQRKLDKIHINISNPNYPDAKVPKGNHMALENIRQRLALLYDIEAQLDYGAKGDAFIVDLEFPFKKK